MLGSASVNMYAKCSVLEKVRKILEEILERNIVLCNALIEGYVQYEHGNEALSCVENMQDEDISPDSLKYITVLKVFGIIGLLEMGEEIHEEVKRKRFIGKTLFVYAKCGLDMPNMVLVMKL